MGNKQTYTSLKAFLLCVLVLAGIALWFRAGPVSPSVSPVKPIADNQPSSSGQQPPPPKELSPSAGEIRQSIRHVPVIAYDRHPAMDMLESQDPLTQLLGRNHISLLRLEHELEDATQALAAGNAPGKKAVIRWANVLFADAVLAGIEDKKTTEHDRDFLTRLFNSLPHNTYLPAFDRVPLQAKYVQHIRAITDMVRTTLDAARPESIRKVISLMTEDASVRKHQSDRHLKQQIRNLLEDPKVPMEDKIVYIERFKETGDDSLVLFARGFFAAALEAGTVSEKLLPRVRGLTGGER